MAVTGSAITSVSIYASDLEKLHGKQIRMSADQGRRLTMPEVIRELVKAAEEKAETGE